MAKLAGTQLKEESARKPLAKKCGEIEWLKKMLAEMKAEMDNSRNEIEDLGTPLDPTGGRRRESGRRTLLGQRRLPCLALGLRRRSMGLCITGSNIGRRREAEVITISAGGNCPLFD